MNAQNNTEALHYLVRQPKTASAHPPVIFLLHGVGSNEQDLFSLADKFPDDFLIISARGPLTLSEGRYAWFHVEFANGTSIPNFPEEEESRKLLAGFVGQMETKYQFDAERVYFIGFSQGAIMSYNVALTYPKLIKGIGVMSGRLMPEIRPLAATADKLKNLKIFISHGTADPVLNIDLARNARQWLEKYGLHPEYHEYTGAQHQINPAMLADLLLWLKK